VVYDPTQGRTPRAYDPTPDKEFAAAMVESAGENHPHNNLQPYLAVNFVIALQGAFPPRPTASP
jgi:microcystin-dependent protein